MTLLYIILIIFLLGILFFWVYDEGYMKGKKEANKHVLLPPPKPVVILPKDTMIFYFEQEFYSYEKITNDKFLQMAIVEFVNCAKKYHCIEISINSTSRSDTEKWSARMRILPFVQIIRHEKESR